jgi:hypothetical protein
MAGDARLGGMKRSLALPLAAALSGCLFPMSRADVEAANAQHVQRMCNDQNYAYETGYNAGLERKRLDTSWVDASCALETRTRIREHYHAGFDAGIANAPLVVPTRSTRTTTYAFVERCTFSSDCGEGRTCRSNQCMGNGDAGDACWFSSDCLSDSCDGSAKVCK